MSDRTATDQSAIDQAALAKKHRIETDVDRRFHDWWHHTGSALRNAPDDDHEEHAHRIAKAAVMACCVPIMERLVELHDKVEDMDYVIRLRKLEQANTRSQDDPMTNFQYAEWLETLEQGDKPCVKALKRIADRLRERDHRDTLRDLVSKLKGKVEWWRGGGGAWSDGEECLKGRDDAAQEIETLISETAHG